MSIAWHGVAWCGVAWRGVAWRGVAWRGVAVRGGAGAECDEEHRKHRGIRHTVSLQFVPGSDPWRLAPLDQTMHPNSSLNSRSILDSKRSPELGRLKPHDALLVRKLRKIHKFIASRPF